MDTKTKFRDCFTDDSPVEDYVEIDVALDAYERHLIHLCEGFECEFCLAEQADVTIVPVPLP